MTDDLNRLRAVTLTDEEERRLSEYVMYANSHGLHGYVESIVAARTAALLDRVERAETERDRLEAAYTAEGACGAIGCRAIDQRDALWVGLSALVDQAEKDGQGIYIDAGRTHVTAVETGLLRSLLAAAPTETEETTR